MAVDGSEILHWRRLVVYQIIYEAENTSQVVQFLEGVF